MDKAERLEEARKHVVKVLEDGIPSLSPDEADNIRKAIEHFIRTIIETS